MRSNNLPAKKVLQRRQQRLLFATGVTVTLLGTLFVAVPILVQGAFARVDCNDHCIPPAPSPLTFIAKAFLAIAVSVAIGFLPYALYKRSTKSQQ
jgi:hypothetical protein